MSSDKSQGGTRINGMDALAALRRARLRAEREALATGTCLVIVENGKTVLIEPRTEAAIRAEEAVVSAG